MQPTTVLMNSAQGIYIPKHFAESYNPEQWRGVDLADIEILRSGPDNELYWEAWESVLNNAESESGMTLHHDGDLFTVDLNGALETLNSFIAERVEYEEFHNDSAYNYGFLLGESWSDSNTENLMDQIKEHGIETRGIKPDVLAELVLDNFEMIPDHSFSMTCAPDSLYLMFFPIGEIEIDAGELIESDIVFDLVKDSSNACFNGSLGYVTSYRGFAAIINAKNLQDVIDESI